jgi:hypothetical protein
MSAHARQHSGTQVRKYRNGIVVLVCLLVAGCVSTSPTPQKTTDPSKAPQLEVVIISPEVDSIVSGPQVELRADVTSDATVNSVEFFEKTKSLGKASLLTGKTYRLQKTLGDGDHEIMAQANETASTIRKFKVLTPKPDAIQLTASSTQVSAFGAVQLSAQVALKAPVQEVQLFLDNQPRATLKAPGFVYTLNAADPPLALGSHDLFLQANTTKSNTVSLEVLEGIRLITPANTSNVSGEVTLDVETRLYPNTQVKTIQYVRNPANALLGSRVSAPFTLPLNTLLLPNGNQDVFVRAETNSKLLTSSVQAISVQNTAESCNPISDPTTLDAILTNLEIPSGPYAGGYLYVNDKRFGEGADVVLNWYFTNIGLLAFVDRMPQAKIRAYLDLYIKESKKNGAFTPGHDIRFFLKPSGNGFSPDFSVGDPFQPIDSDDAYAATFLSLVNRHYHVTCDRAWIEANRTTLKMIAQKNLLEPQLANGLINVRQASNPKAAYLQDNAENHKGLMDFAALMSAMGDPSSVQYLSAAAKVATGIQTVLHTDATKWCTVLDPKTAGFASAWTGVRSERGDCIDTKCPGLQIYPLGISQVFSEVFVVSIPQQQYDDGWVFLNKFFADFWIPINSLPRYAVNAFYQDKKTCNSEPARPWMILGYAAALRQDRVIASSMIKLIDELKTVSPDRIGIDDWGYYERTRRLLSDPTAKPF